MKYIFSREKSVHTRPAILDSYGYIRPELVAMFHNPVTRSEQERSFMQSKPDFNHAIPAGGSSLFESIFHKSQKKHRGDFHVGIIHLMFPYYNGMFVEPELLKIDIV